MLIKLSDPGQLRSLVRFLAFDQNLLVTAISDRELEVGFVGSLNSRAQRTAIESRLRIWRDSHPDAVTVLDD